VKANPLLVIMEDRNVYENSLHWRPECPSLGRGGGAPLPI